jgi:hypothetical protein
MRRLRHPAFLAILLAACSPGEIVPGVRDSTFVATMADLRRVEATAENTSELAASRRRILQQRGLTAEQLESAARALGDDPERALAIWRAIDKRAVNMPADTSRRH